MIESTRKEFDLVRFFVTHTGRLVSRGHIVESVWGHTQGVTSRTIDTHISRIRKKFELNWTHGWRLRAIYQHGYRLDRIKRESSEIPNEKS